MSAQAGRTDAIELLTSDHRTVDRLFEQYEHAGSDDHDRKRSIVDDVVGRSDLDLFGSDFAAAEVLT